MWEDISPTYAYESNFFLFGEGLCSREFRKGQIYCHKFAAGRIQVQILTRIAHNATIPSLRECSVVFAAQLRRMDYLVASMAIAWGL